MHLMDLLVPLVEVQCRVARGKVRMLGLEERIRLSVGDAARLDQVRDRQAGFTKVVSLDSAYHYNTRRAFLEQARDRLLAGGGGRICLSDIILWKRPTTVLGRVLLKVACKATNIPEENLVEGEEYERMLEAVGYRGVRVEFIEEHVFIGLAKFIQRHEERLWSLIRPNLWLRYRVMAAGLRVIHEQRVLRYVIVTATCGDQDPS